MSTHRGRGIRGRLLPLLLCLAIAACSPAARLGTSARAEGVIPEIRVLLRRLGLTDRADLILSGRYGVACEGTELSLTDGARVAVLVREGEIVL